MSMWGQQGRVRIERRDGGRIAVVVLDNARRLNAMNTALMDAFVAQVSALANDEDLRALVVTGEGERAFVGGADISEMAAIKGPDAARAFIARVHACCAAVRAVPVPTIARIQGYAFGAGMELGAACDLRVAAPTASFAMPEVRLGVPSVVEAALLPMLIGWGRTRQLLLTGETIDAATAEAWGFVNRVSADGRLDQAVDEVLEAVLAAAPGALRLQKALIGAWETLPLPQAIEAGIDSFAAAFETGEPTAAMGRFLTEQARRKARA